MQKEPHTKVRPYEEARRRWSSTGQAEGPHEKPALLTPPFWISGLWNWEKINFCHWSHLVCVTLLWQPLQTHIPGISHYWSMLFWKFYPVNYGLALSSRDYFLWSFQTVLLPATEFPHTRVLIKGTLCRPQGLSLRCSLLSGTLSYKL